MDSLRLQQIVNIIPNGTGVADIGTDHALIPIYLARTTDCCPIIAGEKTQGPYRRAQYSIQEAELTDIIDLRLGSGLTIVKPGEVEWAVIAGMGFGTIIEIIQESPEVARSLTGLILQPMQGAGEVRQWLCVNAYTIKDEFLVKEEGKLFQILQVTSGEALHIEDEIFYEVGPVLFAKADPYLGEHITSLINYYENVMQRLDTRTERVEARVAELQLKIEKLKEVLSQWQKKCNASSIS